jgi:hypothetical protein
VPKPFPREFREDVVRVARNREPGQSLKQIATDFGIAESCLRNWLRQADVEDGLKPGTTGAENAELRGRECRSGCEHRPPVGCPMNLDRQPSPHLHRPRAISIWPQSAPKLRLCERQKGPWPAFVQVRGPSLAPPVGLEPTTLRCQPLNRALIARTACAAARAVARLCAYVL